MDKKLATLLLSGITVSAWLLTDKPPAPPAEAAIQFSAPVQKAVPKKIVLEGSERTLDVLIIQEEILEEFQRECEKVREKYEQSIKLRQQQQEAPKADLPDFETLDPFFQAESDYRVPWQITYAICSMESSLGKQLGKHQPSQVMSSEQWTAFVKICRRLGKDPYRQCVSKTGDIGPMQFQPKTWEAFGVDADGDGLADPWSLTDAAASTARYLEKHGFQASPTYSVAAYNGGKMRDPQRAARAAEYARKVIRLAQSMGLPQPHADRKS